MPQVSFYPVATPKEKLSKVASLTLELFHQKQSCLILVENEQAAIFLDDFLWKNPHESFIPHKYSVHEEKEPIVISTQWESFDNRSILFNLTPSAFIYPQSKFSKIIQLEDLTSAEKKTTSISIYKAYVQAGYPIIFVS